MSEATERPWHLHPTGKANVLGQWTVFYGHGETAHNQICQADKANAELIVRACNAFDAMIEALELHVAYEKIPADRGGTNGTKGRAWAAFIAARDAAIAKAKAD